MKRSIDKPPGGADAGPVRDAPAFDFFPERWLVGVAGMSDAEQLAYLRLLCHQWLLGDAGLPVDVNALKRLGGKGVTAAVLAKLPQGADGMRRNARLEVIRAEQRERIAKSRDKIAKMNAARTAGRATLPQNGKAPPHALRTGLPPTVLQESLQAPLQETRQEDREEGLEGDLPVVHDDGGSDVPGEGHRERLGEALEEPLNGFLTPHHPPPTHSERESYAGAWPGLDEVKAYAPTVMAAPECAESFWNGLEACGWVNKFGQPVSDWRPLFRNFATSWKANASQAKRGAATGSSAAARPRNQAYQRPAHVCETDTQF